MAEGVGLLPAHTHNGIVVVVAVSEVHANVGLLVSVLKVVHPARGVGVDVDDVGVQEVVVALQGARDGLTNNAALVIDIGSVLADGGRCQVHLVVGVVVTTRGVKAVTALGSLGQVIDLKAVVHLRSVKFLDTGDGVDAIHALDGTFLVLAGVLPGDILAPVQMRGDGVAFLILLDLELLKAEGVKTLTDNRVTHPVNKLLVLRVGDFGLIHPEGVNRHAMSGRIDAPHRVALIGTLTHRAHIDEHHAKWRGLVKHSGTDAGHLATGGSALADRAARHGRDGDQQYQ